MIPFLSLALREDGAAVRQAIDRVVGSGWFILGPEVERFEAAFAAACGASCAIGVGNGTDALALILKGLGIGAGDEVITSPLSAAYTALAILMAGARPVFADIDAERLTIDPVAAAAAVTARTRAILPVHLYGQPADMEALTSLASNHGLAIVGDCCQAHLATAARQPVGAIGAGAAFSFYPTKNLGALGDGGAVVTNDRSLADRIRRLRNGGQTDRYRHQEAGVNSRLDEVQAAILRARLPFLPAWTERRRALAAAYRTGLSGTSVQLPVEADRGHAYHLFVVRSKRRDDLRAHLQQRGIETLVHYPIPIPEQPALAATQPARCPRAAQACAEVLSLPLYPALTDSQVAEVVGAVREFR